MSDSTPTPDESARVWDTRIGAYVNSLPMELRRDEAYLPQDVAAMSASAKVKLRRIYGVMDRLSAATEGYVACQRGCADCCRMNVTISAQEARMIAEASGRLAAPLATSREHDNREFLGQPCPFLVDNACSVYDVRPLVCRSHFSFDATAHWCAPERSTTVQMKLLRFSGARRAYDGVVGDGPATIKADIRDFFPPG